MRRRSHHLLAAAIAIGVLALVESATGSVAETQDPCPRTRTLQAGPSGGALYSTAAPFEHFGSNRTQVFPHSCTLAQIAGTSHPAIAERSSAPSFSVPYSIVTRNRNQLYVYGYGSDAATQGAFVASVSPGSLKERWRTTILDRSPTGQWSYPGVLLAHGNGFLYAIYGNVLVKLDPDTGKVLARRNLPEDPNETGAAYNGMIVMPDGRIVAKKIERGPCPEDSPNLPATTEAFVGLTCSARNQLPSEIVVVDPKHLKILDSVVPPEPSTGRITWGRTNGRDYVYVAGSDRLYRYLYRDGRLTLDHGWGPVAYRTGAQKPGTGPGILGHFVVIQTNFLPSTAPLTVTAVDTRDSHRVFRIKPFAGSTTGGSWIVSKAALDAANRTVITNDTTVGQMAALHLDPKKGFSIRWRRALKTLDFSALVGGPDHREIVVPDLTVAGDEVTWLRERTGNELAQTGPLSSSYAPGNIVVPGFDGHFYYGSSEGRLWELSP